MSLDSSSPSAGMTRIRFKGHGGSADSQPLTGLPSEQCHTPQDARSCQQTATDVETILVKGKSRGYFIGISLGCPSGLRGLAPETNPSNLIRIMPAEGLRDDGYA